MADINLKTLTPDTSLPTTGFLFGADSQASTNPSVYGVTTAITAILGNAASSDVLAFNSDTILARDTAKIFAQRNGVNSQTFRVYNTYTDASNYERGAFDWTTTANTLTIGTQNAGTGSTRNLQFVVGGTTRLDYGITSAGVWYTSSNIYGPSYWKVGQSNQGITFSGLGYLVYEAAAALHFFQKNSGGICAIATTAGLVSALPAAATATAGGRAFVNDATMSMALGIGTVVVGGGANKVPVYSDGTNWLIG